MPETKRPKTTEEILKEMEEISKGVSTSDSGPKKSSPASQGASEHTKTEEGGAFKSLLGFFIKIHEDEPAQPLPTTAKATPAVPGKNQPAGVPPAKGGAPMPGASGAAPRRVGDLATAEPAPKFAPPKASPSADLSAKPFEEIYREAGLAKSGTPVDELFELMQSPTVANQPLAVKVVAVNLAISAKGTKLDDYIADAVRKDRALDAYQKMLTERSRDLESKTKTEIERIQKEVEEYLKKKQAEIEGLRSQATEVSRQAIEFAVRRQAEEQRLADAVSPFLEGKPNPVTVGNSPDEPEKN